MPRVRKGGRPKKGGIPPLEGSRPCVKCGHPPCPACGWGNCDTVVDVIDEDGVPDRDLCPCYDDDEGCVYDPPWPEPEVKS